MVIRVPPPQNPQVDPELPQPAEPQEVQSSVADPVPVQADVPVEAVQAAQPQSVIRTVTNVDLTTGPPQTAPAQVQPVTTGQPDVQRTFIQNQVTPTDVDPAAAAAEANQAQNTSVLRAIGVPAPVAEGLANPTAADLGSQQFPNTPAPFVDDEAARQAATKQLLQEQQALQARFNQPSNGDWRFRIRLAPGSQYLYNEFNNGILAPLAASDGVIFPYTPSISTSYNANYEVTDLVHSNYRGQFYKNSYVGEISVTGTFTAQDTQEAEYLLAVIHFFKSVTKMFYGQDPQRGTPPPLVYLSGLGQYQFSNHPCVVQSFTYNLPTDVDYIRTQPNNYGNLLNKRNTGPNNSSKLTLNSVTDRLNNARDLLGRLLSKGGKPPPGPGVNNNVISTVYNTNNATYVPTKIDITVTLLPVQSRQLNSQLFSLKQFSNGELLKTGFW